MGVCVCGCFYNELRDYRGLFVSGQQSCEWGSLRGQERGRREKRRERKECCSVIQKKRERKRERECERREERVWLWSWDYGRSPGAVAGALCAVEVGMGEGEGVRLDGLRAAWDGAACAGVAVVVGT